MFQLSLSISRIVELLAYFLDFEKSKMALFDFLVNGCLLVGIGVIGMIANVLCIIIVSRPSMRATSINLIVLGK